MLKEQEKLFNKIAVFVDAIVMTSAFIATYYFCSTVFKLQYIEVYSWILFLVIPVWGFLFYYFKLYASLRLNSISTIIVSVIKAHIVGSVLTTSFIFIINPIDLSRVIFLNFIIISPIFVLLEKILLKGILSCTRRRGYNFRYILIAGCSERVRLLSGMIV